MGSDGQPHQHNRNPARTPNSSFFVRAVVVKSHQRKRPVHSWGV